MNWLPEDPPPIRRAPKWRILGPAKFVAIIAGILAAASWWTWIGVLANRHWPELPSSPNRAAAQPDNGERTVVVVRGIGNATLSPFAVGDDWRLDWECRHSPRRISIVGPPTHIIPFAYDDPSGHAVFAQGGTFAVSITVEGPWKLTITQLSNRID